MFYSIFTLIMLPLSLAFSFDHQHQDWTKWLEKYTKEIPGPSTEVNYTLARKNKEDLNTYLGSLESVTQKEFDTWSQNQKKAFLFNAYNAYTIQLIISNKPVKSIRDLGTLVQSPWKISFVPLLGKKRSLDEIEHDLLRGTYKDPRIHFAVVCASIGCPRLQLSAYTADKLEDQLNQATREFLNDTSRNRIEVKNQTVHLQLSKIFDWYAGDFGGKEKLPEFILPFMAKPNSKSDYSGKKIKVTFLDYDWRLNDISKK